MKRNSLIKILPLSLLTLACMVFPQVVRAQQTSGAAGTGTFPSYTQPTSSSPSSSGASNLPGYYSSDSTAATSLSSLGPSNQINSAKAKSAEKTLIGKSRSAWLAGSSIMGGANSGGWTAGSGTFGSQSGASWIAGANNFGIARQADGIWRSQTASAIPSGVPSQSAILPSTMPSLASRPAPFSTGLTAKGAALVKARGLSSGFASRQGTNFGFGGPGFGHLGTPQGFGKQSLSASHPSSFGSFGSSTGSPHHSPAFGTVTGGSLKDPLSTGGGLGSLPSLGSGLDDSSSGSSH